MHVENICSIEVTIIGVLVDDNETYSFQEFVSSFGGTGGQGCSGTDWYLDITLEVWCRIWRGLLLLKCLLSGVEWSV